MGVYNMHPDKESYDCISSNLEEAAFIAPSGHEFEG
jgi:hypothetical protein